MNHEGRLRQLVELAFDRLCGKINGRRVIVNNEASLQLQLASILKALGELYEETPDERFNIELEKDVRLSDGSFEKSGSDRAKIDIWLSIEDVVSRHKHACAIELKYFKKDNQREPNNRYDVFRDLQNLERYGDFVDYGVLIVATDHPHYINKESYSANTGDFDFRHGSRYDAGTTLDYRTNVPYGPPITLHGSYSFNWRRVDNGLSFLFLEVTPCK